MGSILLFLVTALVPIAFLVLLWLFISRHMERAKARSLASRRHQSRSNTDTDDFDSGDDAGD